ncbi:MAG TPA: IS21 family transposase [Vicinamibacterales bacterium]|nr:IS21 family transposase [Vicinamibacterales bacterium]
MLKRHEIQVLRRADHTWTEIAALSGVSEKTARRIAAEDPITNVDNAAERARRQVGRPSKAEAYRDVLMRALTEDSSLRSVELLHRARLAGYTGGKSALYGLAQTLRVRTVTPLVRFEGLPGEFSQHDFGEVWVTYQDGSEEKVHFFASRLKYSRWVEVSIVPDERVETLVRALVEHLTAFGGIPLVTVFDRPKTIALRWGRDGVVTEWNPTFAGVALDLGIGVEVCWPYRPQEKGSVENLVGWVKGSFFKQRRFLDRADLERQLRAWLTEANTIRPSRATGVPPAARLAEDRTRLRPLKIAPTDLALRIPVSVTPTGVVIHEGHPYSMPPDAIGLPATLYLYRDRVRIIAGRFSADHPRQFQPGTSSILPEHRAQRVAAVSGKRARRYLQRQHLIDLGAVALAYLTELTHRRPRTWIHEVERLHDLLQTHGDVALRAAFERGLAEQAIGAEYIAHYLGATVPALPFDESDQPPTIAAPPLPRGSRVQAADGARRAGAQRRAWTRLSTAASSRRVGGRS